MGEDSLYLEMNASPLLTQMRESKPSPNRGTTTQYSII